MITSKIPNSWQDLQDSVGQVLTQCGFTVEVEKKVEVARGSVELDVFATEDVKGRRYSIAVECKHWKAKIPQAVVHGFRTVVSDLGANVGYIVSTAGFQEGAVKARELTNVELVTWDEFLGKFELSWYEEFFSPEIARHLDPLLSYVEPFLPAWWAKLDAAEQDRYMELKANHEEFGWLIMTFTPYARMGRADKSITPLPVIKHIPKNSSLITSVPATLLAHAGYQEFLDEAVAYGTNIIAQFRQLRDAAALR